MQNFRVTLSRRQCLKLAGLALGGAGLLRDAVADERPDTLESPRVQRHSVDQPQITIATATGRHTVYVDIVFDRDTSDSTLKGKRPPPPDEGVLFVVTVVRPISLSNSGVPFATDILFVTQDGRIIEIHPAIMPNDARVFTANIPVKAALQTRAGLIRSLDIVAGDHVLHKIFGRTV